MASKEQSEQAKIQKRLEIAILANNPELLEAMRNDNHICAAARCNANTVIFDAFILPHQNLGKIGAHHRVFIFESCHETSNNPYAESLQREVRSNSGNVFLYQYTSDFSMDSKSLFAKVKERLVKDLKFVYEQT